MDEDGLPIVGAAIDLTKVAPIDPKRILAFLNHFICHTVNFLNKFSVVCETKLEDVNVRIQRIETSLSILESKLASIPGLEDISIVSTNRSNETTSEGNASGIKELHASLPPVQSSPSDSTSNITNQSVQEVPQHRSVEVVLEKPPEVTVENTSKTTVAQDPRYAKYLKMIQVGVPAMAFRSKMMAEGLDPDLLNTPNVEAPEAFRRSASRSDSQSCSSNSDNEFSDGC